MIVSGVLYSTLSPGLSHCSYSALTPYSALTALTLLLLSYSALTLLLLSYSAPTLRLVLCPCYDLTLTLTLTLLFTLTLYSTLHVCVCSFVPAPHKSAAVLFGKHTALLYPCFFELRNWEVNFEIDFPEMENILENGKEN